MESDEMDAVFRALASESRRRILDIVKDRPGCSVNHVAGFFDESRINVMKHLRVLEEARLIHSEKQGRTRRLYFNCVPIQMIHERWTTEYSAMWAGRLTRVKYRVETDRRNDG
jgi:DNA-binding transcriptional ArsR family regulator